MVGFKTENGRLGWGEQRRMTVATPDGVLALSEDDSRALALCAGCLVTVRYRPGETTAKLAPYLKLSKGA